MFMTLKNDDKQLGYNNALATYMPSMAFEYVGGRVIMFNNVGNEWYILSDFEGDLVYYKVFNYGDGWQKEVIATNTVLEET